MMKSVNYNGYANRETWLMSVWDIIPALAEEAQEQNLPQVDADWCKDEFMEMADLLMPHKKFGDNIVTDLLTGAIDRIDWDEIEEHVNEQILLSK